MILKKQLPSITVTIRVPEDMYKELDAHLTELKNQGYRASKNSVYIDALDLYLQMLKEEEKEEEKENEYEHDRNAQ